MQDAQVTESAYVWTNSKNLHLDWDPEALYFDARDNHNYGQMVNDSWSETGNNCIIKWNAKRRRVEVWTIVDVPLYKELGAAYNDPYWYRTNNGIRTREQAEQIREYYNKSELPPYGEAEVETNTQAVTPTPESPLDVGPTAPNLSVINLIDMENDMEAANRPDEIGTETGSPNGAHQLDRPMVINLEMEDINERDLEVAWKQDAVTLTEEDYIRKHYYDKAETSNSRIPMNMYLGLCTGHLLSASLLLAITEVQLQQKWYGMRCRDLTVKTQPQEDGQCSPTSPRSRAAIRSTEVMCIVHVSPMHYSMVIVLKQDLHVDLIWCDSLQRDGR